MFLTSLALPQSVRTILVHTLPVTDLFTPLAQPDIVNPLAKNPKPTSAEQLLQYTSVPYLIQTRAT